MANSSFYRGPDDRREFWEGLNALATAPAEYKRAAKEARLEEARIEAIGRNDQLARDRHTLDERQYDDGALQRGAALGESRARVSNMDADNRRAESKRIADEEDRGYDQVATGRRAPRLVVPNEVAAAREYERKSSIEKSEQTVRAQNAQTNATNAQISLQNAQTAQGKAEASRRIASDMGELYLKATPAQREVLTEKWERASMFSQLSPAVATELLSRMSEIDAGGFPNSFKGGEGVAMPMQQAPSQGQTPLPGYAPPRRWSDSMGE